MSRVTTLEVQVGSLVLRLSLYYTQIRILESKIVSKSSKLDEAATKLESTELCLQFAEHSVTLMWKQVQRPGPQICEV